MKNVLFISYFFPPLGGPGVQRSVKFCRYLPQYGWHPIVLTVKNVAYIAYDESLLKELLHCGIVRTGSLDFMRLLYLLEKQLKKCNTQSIYTGSSSSKKQFLRDVFPIDSKIGWIPFAVKKGERIIEKERISNIYCSVGPFSSAIVGYKLSKKFNIPLVIDYRDLFIGKPDESYFSNWHMRYAYQWESKVLVRSKRVIINTHKAKKRIQQLYPMVDRNKFDVIYNGYDNADFSDIRFDKISKDIVFTYTGGFYGDRTPKFFIKALNELIKKKLLSNNIKFQFIGNYSEEVFTMLKDKTISEYIVVKTQVDHKKAVKFLTESDFLMLFISHKGSEIVIPAKLFEYFAARKPILAMCPPQGEAAELIMSHNAGIVCSSKNIPAIQKSVLDLINYTLRGIVDTIFSCKRNDYSSFEREFQAGELAHLLDRSIS